MLATRSLEQTFAFPTDLGWMALSWTETGLQRFTIGHPSHAAALAQSETEAAPDDLPDDLRQLVDLLQAYAAGEKVSFREIKLNLDHLTDFQRRVVQLCRKIPAGRTLTYGELAAQAGSPNAARAVGSVMAKNRFPIIVPCHRVVGSSGSLGGFSAPTGVCLKQRMLELEGCVLGAKR